MTLLVQMTRPEESLCARGFPSNQGHQGHIFTRPIKINRRNEKYVLPI